MAFKHGSDSTFAVDDSGGTARSITGVDNVSLTRNGEPAEVTSLGNNSKAFIAGLKDASVSISGSWDVTSTTGNDVVLSGIIGGAAGTISFSPDGGTTTYSCEALCTSYDVTSPVADKVSFSADFQVTGDVSRA
jgi:predicted secreted protein